MILDNMLWVPEKSVSPSTKRQILSDLTVQKRNFVGPNTIFVLYRTVVVDGKSWLGVPREWGFLKLKGAYEDKTARPFMEWPEVTFSKGMSYWDGQPQAIKDVTEKFNTGNYGTLLKAPCGSGKTLKGLSVASHLHTKTLVVVHKNDLARQWKECAKSFFPNTSVGHIQGSKWAWRNKHVVTATAQTLYSRRNALPPNFLKEFGFVIYDEVHRYPAETFEKVLSMFHCRFRLGVSATLRRQDGLTSILKMHLGGLAHTSAANKLVGRYCQPKLDLGFKDFQFKGFGGKISHATFVSAIASNHVYNNWVLDELIKAVKSGRQVLVVGDRVAQLVYIHKRLQREGMDAGLYVGSLGNRKKVTDIQLQKAMKCTVVLGTFQKIGEGTDIPRLDTIFLVTPRKDVEQAFGRIQREFPGKKEPLIIDPVIKTRYMGVLGNKRQAQYNKAGFKPERVH